jgi:hypothetical protein
VTLAVARMKWPLRALLVTATTACSAAARGEADQSAAAVGRIRLAVDEAVGVEAARESLLAAAHRIVQRDHFESGYGLSAAIRVFIHWLETWWLEHEGGVQCQILL